MGPSVCTGRARSRAPCAQIGSANRPQRTAGTGSEGTSLRVEAGSRFRRLAVPLHARCWVWAARSELRFSERSFYLANCAFSEMGINGGFERGLPRVCLGFRIGYSVQPPSIGRGISRVSTTGNSLHVPWVCGVPWRYPPGSVSDLRCEMVVTGGLESPTSAL